MTTQTIRTRTGPCGSGKTHTTLEEVLANKGHYIWAVEKVDLIFEIDAKLRAMAAAKNIRIEIEPIASQRSERGTTRNCRNAIEALPRIFENDNHDHVIAIVTHKSFLNIDSSGLGNWHLIIDEIPSVVANETLQSRAAASWFDTHFSLTPARDSGWSTVGLKSDLTRTEIATDTTLATLLTFYDRVVSESTEVIADVTDWAEVTKKDVEWNWYSTWDVAQLANFASTTLLGNDFANSIFARLVMARNPDIIWNEIATPLRMSFAKRRMVINYFAYGHIASAGHFASDVGKSHLKSVAAWLRANVSADDHIWSCNGTISHTLGFIPGINLTPRQAGSNLWAGKTAATMIYSAKPSKVERTIFNAIGIDPETICAERERETMVQFFARTSVRDPASTTDINLNCYDIEQARHLERYFKSLGYVEVELNLIDLGFADHQRVRAIVAPKPEKSPEEIAARAEIAREKSRLRMAALRAERRALNPPKRIGRPRKSA